MTPYARIFKRALQEKLAFVPMGAQGPQASGPGGAPMGPPGAPPGAPPGGAPMDPSMGGAPPPGMPPGAPMDPGAGGIPPMPPGDPSAGGAPPGSDPSMGGAPPMDPSMGGMPPMDPSMMAPPPEAGSGAGVTEEGADIVDKITKRTMDIVRQTLEMVGKTKTPKSDAPEAAPPPTPAQLPGPVTGMTGFDPSTIQGPMKTAGILGKALKK